MPKRVGPLLDKKTKNNVFYKSFQASLKQLVLNITTLVMRPALWNTDHGGCRRSEWNSNWNVFLLNSRRNFPCYCYYCNRLSARPHGYHLQKLWNAELWNQPNVHASRDSAKTTSHRNSKDHHQRSKDFKPPIFNAQLISNFTISWLPFMYVRSYKSNAQTSIIFPRLSRKTR